MDVLVGDGLGADFSRRARPAGAVDGGPDQGLPVLERRVHGGVGIAVVVLRDGSHQAQAAGLHGKEITSVGFHQLHAQGQDFLRRTPFVRIVEQVDDAVQQALIRVARNRGRGGRLRSGLGLGELGDEGVRSGLDLVAFGQHVLGHRVAVDLHRPVHGHQLELVSLLQDLEMDLADMIARQHQVVHGAASGGENVMGHHMGFTRGLVLQDHGFPALLEKS